MKGKGGHLDEIKRIEQKREERRIKMEDMKRERKEKEAYNLASGKNVDIDFEIMIDKNRFRDKMLCPHTSSADNKVPTSPSSSLSAFASDPSLRKKRPMGRLTLSLRPTHK